MFTAKDIMSSRQIISRRLYVRLKETCLLANRGLLTVNDLNNIKV